MDENTLANALCQLVNREGSARPKPIPSLVGVELSAWGTVYSNNDSGGDIEVTNADGSKDNYSFVLVKQQR